MKKFLLLLLFFNVAFCGIFADILTENKISTPHQCHYYNFDFSEARRNGATDEQIYYYIKENCGGQFNFEQAEADGLTPTKIVNILIKRKEINDLALLQGYNLGVKFINGKIYFQKTLDNGQIQSIDMTDELRKKPQETQTKNETNILTNSLWRMLDWIVIMIFVLPFYYSGRNLINKIKNHKNTKFIQRTNTKEEKINRLFKVFYFISLLLTATVVGGIIGVPLFLILLITQYIIYGNFNLHFVFYNENNEYNKSEIFLLVCYCVLFCVLSCGILAAKFHIININYIRKDDFFTFIGFCFGYFLYIVFIQYVLIGNLKFWKLFAKNNIS